MTEHVSTAGLVSNDDDSLNNMNNYDHLTLFMLTHRVKFLTDDLIVWTHHCLFSPSDGKCLPSGGGGGGGG